MKRQWRVLAALEEMCRMQLNKESFAGHQPVGFTAEEVAQASFCSRSNASSDLNALHREGAVVKIVSRAAYYLPLNWLEELFPERKGTLPQVMRHHKELFEKTLLQPIAKKAERTTAQDSFTELIGHQGSLKPAIEQAKAAILYPPKGLDTLLVGVTGVGKTLFAEKMFQFAACQEKVKSGQSLVVFNCADYAANPQLLLSQLFGHTKGAFTGAEREKIGLVEQADCGMLFLDEVHRLPPEGQEMLFYLLDRGEFRRLGEAGTLRRAKVRVVAATTENPDSALLRTFLRRIPVVIQLPQLAERPLEERLELIRYLLAREAVHIQGGVAVSQEALWALLLYRCPGNVGQLRNDLQLVCAKAFLYREEGDAEVCIGYEALPLKIKQAIVYDQTKRLETNRVLCQLGGTLQIRPDGQAAQGESNRRLPEGFYHTIAERMRFLRNQGIDAEEIVQCVEMEVDNYFKRLSPQDTDLSSDRLRSMLAGDFLAVFDAACNRVQTSGMPISRQLYYALAVHTAATVERLRSNLPIMNPRAESIRQEYPKAYEVAAEMAKMIGTGMNVVMPEAEISFIALMLATFDQRQENQERKVGVVVIAHGDSTASSMVDFANRLLGVKHAKAIDMPLETDVGQVKAMASHLVQEADEGKGVILLVDMGSLSGLAEKLARESGVVVRGVEMVTTLMVLHVLHKAILPQYDLNSVYRAAWDVRSMLQTTPHIAERVAGKKDRALVTTCFTGQGAAAKIKKMLEKLLQQWQVNTIRVIPIEAGSRDVLQTRLGQLQQSYDIIASVGSIDPEIAEKPHISLETLLQDGTGNALRKLVLTGTGDVSLEVKTENMDWEMLHAVVGDMLDEFLTFVNPRKVVETLAECLKLVEEGMEFRFSSSGMVRMMVHCGCMVERILTNATISYPEVELFKTEYQSEYQTIKTAFMMAEKQFFIEITAAEICHLIEICNMERQKFRMTGLN
ncbi:sigma 54-interacting transcriptional regulator [Azotosporobacter soli]|uniref:sigma 54-interacting transcriptional regulator n=1 Tax=Azotosporobacter soli TaxID=3055040 RepID=UPI0031FEBB20